MNISTRIMLMIVSVLLALGFTKYRDIVKPLPAPKIDLEEYWGSGDASNHTEQTEIKSYKIFYNDDVIFELQDQLKIIPTLHPPLEDVAFEYGFNSDTLVKVITYWRDNYLPNWRKREVYLNQFPQFRTQIQGLDIHFIRANHPAKEGVKVLPILLLHGWPGSVREFYELIPKLVLASEDKPFVFDVIVPSLPGYGWSQGARKQGLGTVEMAVIMRNLMHRLGHSKFYVHGGDWGSLIGSNIASLFPDSVLGYHSNMCGVMTLKSVIKQTIATNFPSYFIDEEYRDWFSASSVFEYLLEESGYMHIQATKPDTIGTALAVHPIGLAVYILEKFSTWTNPAYRSMVDGGLEKDFTMDALLDNVMIYYLTESITTSVRLYSEGFSTKEFAKNMDRVQTPVPTGCVRFRHELVHTVDWAVRDKFTNLIHTTYHANGGHFAAMQLPEVMYADIVNFVKKLEYFNYPDIVDFEVEDVHQQSIKERII